MTIDEILACKIPKNHHLALAILKTNIENMNHIGTYKEKVLSLCASFSALHEIAQYKFKPDDIKKAIAYGDDVLQKVRTSVFSEALAVVDRMGDEKSDPADVHTYPSEPHHLWEGATLDEIKSRLTVLGKEAGHDK